jgi:uncharacterized OB-fold protein
MPKDIAYPDPAVDHETRPYWEGAARGELVLQRCRGCGIVQHRPRAQCAHCLSPGIEHFVASGRGSVHTWTVTHQNVLPAFAPACPYVLAYVDLEEGPRLLTNIVGCAPEQVRIGMPVRVDFVSTGEFAVPRFRPA